LRKSRRLSLVEDSSSLDPHDVIGQDHLTADKLAGDGAIASGAFQDQLVPVPAGRGLDLHPTKRLDLLIHKLHTDAEFGLAAAAVRGAGLDAEGVAVLANLDGRGGVGGSFLGRDVQLVHESLHALSAGVHPLSAQIARHDGGEVLDLLILQSRANPAKLKEIMFKKGALGNGSTQSRTQVNWYPSQRVRVP
jgi:hypothetical protein